MTMTYAPRPNIRNLTVVEPTPVQDRVAVRCEALIALDSFVRPLLAEKLHLPFPFGRPAIELTIYEEVYRRSRAGGHWTVNARLLGMLTHSIAGYTVELHFDD